MKDAAGSRLSGFEGGVEERPDVLESAPQRLLAQRIGVEQHPQERGVAEVAQQHPIAGHEELLGVLPAEVLGVHLPVEVGRGAQEVRAQQQAEVCLLYTSDAADE